MKEHTPEPQTLFVDERDLVIVAEQFYERTITKSMQTLDGKYFFNIGFEYGLRHAYVVVKTMKQLGLLRKETEQLEHISVFQKVTSIENEEITQLRAQIAKLKAENKQLCADREMLVKEVLTKLPSSQIIEENGKEGGLKDGELQLFWEGATWFKNHVEKILFKMKAQK